MSTTHDAVSHPAPDPHATDRSPATASPAEPSQGFSPVRVGAALFLGGALWVGPFFANNAVLLPARLSEIAPDDKVGLIAVIAVTGSIVAMIANVFFGALSDLTRSRFGRRSPWMVIGSIGASATLFAMMTATTATTVVILWCVFQFFLNAIAAPLLAMLADRVPRGRRGTFSAIYGVGALIGVFGSQIVASGFVTDPLAGIAVFAVVVLVGGPLAVALAGESSSRGLPRARLTPGMLIGNFSFPRRQSRDFYLALSGKLLFVVGYYAVTGYQLYILTDYLGLGLAEAGGLIGLMGLIGLGTALVFGFVSGPISDRLGRRKALVMGSALLVAVATLLPFAFPEVWAMLLFALLGGIGNGVFNSVDQALNTEVLPSPDTAAKDLGILNLANTGGQIIGPGLTSAVVGLSGGYGFVFVAAAGVLVVAAVLIAPIRSVR